MIKRNAILLLLCILLVFSTGCKKSEKVPAYDTLTEREKEQSIKESLGEDAYIFLPKTYVNAVTSISLNGGEFTVGTDSTGKNDGYYINPICKTFKNVGYYIKANKGSIEYSDWYTDTEDSNYYLPDILYSDRIDCTYVSEEEYGIKWKEDISVTGDVGDTIISVRAVNLGTGEYLGTFYINLLLDKVSLNYCVGSVKALSEDTGETKNIALSYAGNLASAYETVPKGMVFTEKVDLCYFYKVIKADGYGSYSGKIKGDNSFLYACTVPFTYGYTTVYLSEDKEVLGYDALYPFDMDSLIAPRSYFEVY
jgi:hypothetical protein